MNLSGWLLFLLISFTSCNDDKEIDDLKEYTGPHLEVDSVVTLYSDSAQVVVRLEAAKQLQFENGDQEFPQGIFITFFEKDGTTSSTLKANKAYYYKEEDLYTAIGNVIVKSFVKKEQLNTEELNWKRDEERIFTDKFVRIETEEDIHMGEGLTARQDFSNWKILKPTGEIIIKEEISPDSAAQPLDNGR